MYHFEVYLQIIFLQVILLKLPNKATGHHYYYESHLCDTIRTLALFLDSNLYIQIAANTVNLTNNQVQEKTIIQYTNYT